MFEWTEEVKQKLITLWAEGLSASKIAKELGCTKNSVIGKVHRLQLPQRGSPIGKGRSKGSCNIEQKVKTVKEVKPVETKPEETEIKEKVVKPKQTVKKKLTLFDLKHDQCHWPEGDPKEKDFHFCGKKTYGNSVYCKEHYNLSYIFEKTS